MSYAWYLYSWHFLRTVWTEFEISFPISRFFFVCTTLAFMANIIIRSTWFVIICNHVEIVCILQHERWCVSLTAFVFDHGFWLGWRFIDLTTDTSSVLLCTTPTLNIIICWCYLVLLMMITRSILSTANIFNIEFHMLRSFRGRGRGCL